MKTSLAFKFANFAKRAGIRFDALHNPAVLNMRSEIISLDGGIQFAINGYPDGSWSAKSVNVDGIITGGRNQSEMIEVIKDAVFTYFDIEPQYCNDSLLKGAGEKKTVKNEMYVTA
jgi:hypothetical protein